MSPLRAPRGLPTPDVPFIFAAFFFPLFPLVYTINDYDEDDIMPLVWHDKGCPCKIMLVQLGQLT